MFDNAFNYPEVNIDGQCYLQVLDFNKLADSSGVKVELSDNPYDEVAVFLINGKLFAISNICPHKHTREIYEGAIENYTVSCPFHGWEFDLETGENKNPHLSKKSLKKYKIIQKDNKVFIQKPEYATPKWMQNM